MSWWWKGKPCMLQSMGLQRVGRNWATELNCCCCCCQVASVMSDSVRPQRQQPTRLPRPWDSPGKNTGVGCHFLLQCMKIKSESEVTQSCPTLAIPWTTSYQAPLSILQARVLEWGCHCLLPWTELGDPITNLRQILRANCLWVSTSFIYFPSRVLWEPTGGTAHSTVLLFCVQMDQVGY